MKQAYLIYPPRTPAGMKEKLLSAMSAHGYLVTDPHIFPPQRRLDLMISCDTVFLYWPGTSPHCNFEAGMAFALKKTIGVIEIGDDKPGLDVYRSVLRDWEVFTRLLPRDDLRIKIDDNTL